MNTSNICTKVTVRQAKLKNGMISLYLDYYPAIRNPKTIEFNKDMRMKAEGIRCIRVLSLINEQFGFLDKTKQKADFLTYFKEKCRVKHDRWGIVYKHFSKYVNGKCTFGEVTIELCRGFREYLLNAHQLKHTKQMLSQNSAACYYSTFRLTLLIPIRNRLLLVS